MLKRLGQAFARLRGKSAKGVPDTAFSVAQREPVTTVAVPWRSSTTWDQYNLRVYPHRDVDRFQFYTEIEDRISVRAEVLQPGRG